MSWFCTQHIKDKFRLHHTDRGVKRRRRLLLRGSRWLTRLERASDGYSTELKQLIPVAYGVTGPLKRDIISARITTKFRPHTTINNLHKYHPLIREAMTSRTARQYVAYEQKIWNRVMNYPREYARHFVFLMSELDTPLPPLEPKEATSN